MIQENYIVKPPKFSSFEISWKYFNFKKKLHTPKNYYRYSKLEPQPPLIPPFILNSNCYEPNTTQ